MLQGHLIFTRTGDFVLVNDAIICELELETVLSAADFGRKTQWELRRILLVLQEMLRLGHEVVKLCTVARGFLHHNNNRYNQN